MRATWRGVGAHTPALRLNLCGEDTMAYAVLDDGFHGHPKILRGGPIIELLQLRAIAHCNRYLTDGVIDQAVLPTLIHGLERLEIDGTPANDIDWVAQLLTLGLWERHDRGYLVHDYLDFNRCREEVEWLKAQKRSAGSKGGQASAQARATAPARPPAVAPAQAPASIQANAAAGAQALTLLTKPKETTSSTSAAASAKAPASNPADLERRRLEYQEHFADEHPEWSSRQIEDAAISAALNGHLPAPDPEDPPF